MIHTLFKCGLVLSALVFLAFLSIKCSNKVLYGLHSNEGHFVYSYFLNNADLLIKNRVEFNKKFETIEYKKFKEEINHYGDKSGQYIQPEPLFLPIIQRINVGSGSVFIFEAEEKESEGRIFKRIACQCSNLKDIMKIPADCVGYYMIDDWEWPPKIFEIVEGEISIEHKSLIAGTFEGHIELIIDDDIFAKQKRVISGNFNVLDKNKLLFLNIPARIK